MNNDLQNKLYKKYPKIFAEANLSVRESCMGWGISTDDGWYCLIDNLCYLIQFHVDNPDLELKKDPVTLCKLFWNSVIWNYLIYPFDKKYKLFKYFRFNKGFYKPIPRPQVVATQIKEKFGGLRFHVKNADDFVWGAITLAESMSMCICEKCGSTNNVSRNSGGWIKTLCADCRKNKK